MYQDEDLDRAVREGIFTPSSVSAFRDLMARRPSPEGIAPDEESVRLISSFNDVFVTIAAGLLLWALGWLGTRTSAAGGHALVAAAAWAFAEHFTRRRRMALPSIALLLAFVWNVFSAGLSLVGVVDLWGGGYGVAACALAAALAAYGHWLRFRVPVTVAAGAVAVAGAVAGLLLAMVPAARDWTRELAFLAGLGVFALAMAWDMKDPERRTRRSDVGFWLHLAAAPLLVHPVFSALALAAASGGGTSAALWAIGAYLALAVVALAVDRRALLVSALAYVLYAMNALFEAAGSFGGSFPLTALMIGSVLLLLSALWQQVRRAVLSWLPAALRHHLPPTRGP